MSLKDSDYKGSGMIGQCYNEYEFRTGGYPPVLLGTSHSLDSESKAKRLPPKCKKRLLKHEEWTILDKERI